MTDRPVPSECPPTALSTSNRRDIDALVELWDEVNARVKQMGSVCAASGRCCRFDEFGHRLYFSTIEADLLFQVPPLSGNEAEQEAEPGTTRCPYQQGRHCTARERRPLGCRVFFCDPASEDQQAALTEEFLGRLKQLHQDQGRPWRYASLAHWVKEHTPSVARSREAGNVLRNEEVTESATSRLTQALPEPDRNTK